jgi:NADH-quinone oxidoreductase subunit N
VLSAGASAFLLFGLALIYAETGTMEFSRIGTIAKIQDQSPLLLLAGGALLLAGLGFKLGIAPFHLWVPDVYQGAPAPITAFVATASKAAVLALLLRVAGSADLLHQERFRGLVAAAALLSILFGNLLALRQQQVKRLLAYSSIAHLGYALIAFLAGGERAAEAVTIYVAAYMVMTLGAFTVVTMLSDPEQDGDALTRYAGLFRRMPWLATAMVVMLLSLAGIPLTIGFIGKFYVVAAGVAEGQWALLAMLVAGSIIGLFYYLRVIAAMAGEVSAPDVDRWTRQPQISTSWMAGCALAILTALTLWTGLYPEPLIRLVRSFL